MARSKPRKYHFHTAIRKDITACLLRAIKRHEKVRRRLGTTMPWPDYKRLMDWQAARENYLRQQRSLVYNRGQHTDRSQEAAQRNPTPHHAGRGDAGG